MKLGIDLGGSKIEIIALDNQGVELLRRRVATPQGDYSATLHAIENLAA
jgi:fructokinase